MIHAVRPRGPPVPGVRTLRPRAPSSGASARRARSVRSTRGCRSKRAGAAPNSRRHFASRCRRSDSGRRARSHRYARGPGDRAGAPRRAPSDGARGLRFGGVSRARCPAPCATPLSPALAPSDGPCGRGRGPGVRGIQGQTGLPPLTCSRGAAWSRGSKVCGTEIQTAPWAWQIQSTDGICAA